MSQDRASANVESPAAREARSRRREVLDLYLEDTRQQEVLGLPAVLLVPSQLRWLLSRFLRRAVPDLKVIANGEVPDSKIIKVTSIIGARK